MGWKQKTGFGRTGVRICGFLTGKHASVAGGSRGIGAAIATELARLGANLTLMGRDKAALDSHTQKIAKEFAVEVASVICDVSDETSVQAAFSAAQNAGEAYVLVNNAGQSDATSFVEMKRELWDRM